MSLEIRKSEEKIPVPHSTKPEEQLGWWEKMSRGLGALKQAPQTVIDSVDTHGLDEKKVEEVKKQTDVFAKLEELGQKIDRVQETINSIPGHERSAFAVEVKKTPNERQADKEDVAFIKKQDEMRASGFAPKQAEELAQASMELGKNKNDQLVHLDAASLKKSFERMKKQGN